MTTHLTDRILVPLANEADAERTVDALETRLDPAESELLFVHVIEKAGGAPDKAPLAAREKQAEGIFEIVRDEFVDADLRFETELRYDTSVTDAVLAAADEFDATVIAFVPRPERRITALLTRDLTDRLVSNDRYPVVVLPRPREE